jgi:hypothetical protein
VSVVSKNSIVGGDFDTLDVGAVCQVKQQSKLFSGKVAGSGKIVFMLQLENSFIVCCLVLIMLVWASVSVLHALSSCCLVSFSW